MNRRTFLFRSSGLLLTVWFAPALSAATPANDRIGMGTVLFRYRFRQTRPADLPPLQDELTLLKVPAYYRERFGVRQVEFWSNHFESLEPTYLAELKRKLTAAEATLINVQVDSDYNLASPDPEKRRRSLAEVRRWIDAAATLGSKAVRVNPGNGDVTASIAAMREVNAYAQDRGLPLLVENHFGIEMDPEVHLRILREAGPENIHALPDFGNYSEEARFAALEQILPHAYLVSAKAVQFNDRYEHLSYDFDRCVRMAERAGFTGIYSVEQWSREYQPLDYAKVADWLITRVRANLSAA